MSAKQFEPRPSIYPLLDLINAYYLGRATPQFKGTKGPERTYSFGLLSYRLNDVDLPEMEIRRHWQAVLIMSILRRSPNPILLVNAPPFRFWDLILGLGCAELEFRSLSIGLSLDSRPW